MSQFEISFFVKPYKLYGISFIKWHVNCRYIIKLKFYMKNEDVYKFYGWNPSDGDYKSPNSERVILHSPFSYYFIRIYNKLKRVIILKFF